jgi:hypothetical protein
MGRWTGKTNTAHIEYCTSASRVGMMATSDTLRALRIRRMARGAQMKPSARRRDASMMYLMQHSYERVAPVRRVRSLLNSGFDVYGCSAGLIPHLLRVQRR